MQRDVAESAVREPPSSLHADAAVAGTKPLAGPVSGLAGRIAGLLDAQQTLIKYAITGASGYLVYLAILTFIYDLGVGPLLPAKDESVDLIVFTHGDARLLITTLIATQASIVTVFAGHSRWTFAKRDVEGKPLWLRFAQFETRALVSTLGILTVIVNAAVLSGIHHFLAVPIGLVVTFCWNWLWDSRLIWRRTPNT